VPGRPLSLGECGPQAPPFPPYVAARHDAVL